MERHFDQELDELKKVLLEMCGLAERSIRAAVGALKTLDGEAARSVITDDEAIDRLEVRVDEMTFDLTARHQPMARDLRLLMMVPRISTELERIADYAVNIAQRTMEMFGKPHIKPLVDIPRLGDLAERMVRESIEAFVTMDGTLARGVCRQDDDADFLRDLVYKELVEMIAADGAIAGRAIPLILIAQYLERIADHATNIAEEVVYLAEARIIKHQQ